MRNLDPAIKLIAEFEGLYLKPYLCPAKIPTIGIGTTAYPGGKPVSMDDPEITEVQAYDYLKDHLKQDCHYLEKFLADNKVSLNNNQFCSLVSFAYNCGLGPILTPGRSFYGALKHGSKKEIVEAFMAFTRATVHGKRVVLKGLERRRIAECKLYFS